MAESVTSPATASHDALRDLLARLLQDPSRLTGPLTHEIDAPFHVAPHAHTDLLQLDLVTGCSGTAWIDDARHSLRDTTAMLSYPGQRHGYELLPGRGTSRVYLIKIRVEPDWPVLARRPLPDLTTGLAENEALVDAIQAVIRLLSMPNTPALLLLARLAESLAIWPTGSEPQGVYREQAAPDRQLAAAIDLIDTRPADPPSVDELAEAAALSPRHFARRFKQAFAATPHEMITARRLQRAKQLLLTRRLKVHQVADQLGFSSVATFSRWFSHAAGVSPSRYQTDPSIL